MNVDNRVGWWGGGRVGRAAIIAPFPHLRYRLSRFSFFVVSIYDIIRTMAKKEI